MIRMQVQLTEEQHRAIKQLAERRGISASAIVREGVDLALRRTDPDREKLWERALAAAGRFSSGTGDMSERHDEIFVEAIMDFPR